MPGTTPPSIWWGRGGAESPATRRKIGGGETGPLCHVPSDNICTSSVSVCLTPVSTSLCAEGCSVFARWGRIQKPRASLSTGCPRRQTSLSPASPRLAGLKGPSENFIKGKIVHLSVLCNRSPQRALDWESAVGSPAPPLPDSLGNLEKVA